MLYEVITARVGHREQRDPGEGPPDGRLGRVDLLEIECAPGVEHGHAASGPAEYLAVYKEKVAPKKDAIYQYLQFDEMVGFV